MKTAIVGGGAAGFFLAINLKELCPEMDVSIFEGHQRVLQKVRISGGGRCNCTNTFADVRDLSAVYPRGHRLLKRLFKSFDYDDAYAWFERHGVPLVCQDDNCVFPAAQDSQVVIDCFLREARHHNIQICLGQRIENPEQLFEGFDYVALTTGGASANSPLLKVLADNGHAIERPVPSLFTFSINVPELRSLMGTVVNTSVLIPSTKLRAEGPLLITHWGVSGPAILKLSSYAARYLAERNYQSPLSINWVNLNEEQARQQLSSAMAKHPQKQLLTLNPFGFPARLWSYLLERANGTATTTTEAAALSQKSLNRLVATLTADTYIIASRAPFRDEFVTCGGVALSSVNPNTLESRTRPHLFFAGELLDIDGITGGFNFQAAWTTAFTVATSIASSATLPSYRKL